MKARSTTLGLFLAMALPVGLLVLRHDLDQSFPRWDIADYFLYATGVIDSFKSGWADGFKAMFLDRNTLKPILHPLFAIPALLMTAGNISLSEHIVTTAFFAAFVAYLFLIFKETLRSPVLAVVASWVIGTLSWVLELSIRFESDLPMATMALAAGWHGYRSRFLKSVLHSVIAGIALGLAFCFRPVDVAVFLGLPTAFFLIASARGGWPSRGLAVFLFGPTLAAILMLPYASSLYTWAQITSGVVGMRIGAVLKEDRLRILLNDLKDWGGPSLLLIAGAGALSWYRNRKKSILSSDQKLLWLIIAWISLSPPLAMAVGGITPHRYAALGGIAAYIALISFWGKYARGILGLPLLGLVAFNHILFSGILISDFQNRWLRYHLEDWSGRRCFCQLQPSTDPDSIHDTLIGLKRIIPQSESHQIAVLWRNHRLERFSSLAMGAIDASALNLLARQNHLPWKFAFTRDSDLFQPGLNAHSALDYLRGHYSLLLLPLFSSVAPKPNEPMIQASAQIAEATSSNKLTTLGLSNTGGFTTSSPFVGRFSVLLLSTQK